MRHSLWVGTLFAVVCLATSVRAQLAVSPSPGWAVPYVLDPMRVSKSLTPMLRPLRATPDFSLYVRAYWPKTSVTDGSWTPPAVQKTN
jgi:hypothetical protein